MNKLIALSKLVLVSIALSVAACSQTVQQPKAPVELPVISETSSVKADDQGVVTSTVATVRGESAEEALFSAKNRGCYYRVVGYESEGHFVTPSDAEAHMFKKFTADAESDAKKSPGSLKGDAEIKINIIIDGPICVTHYIAYANGD